MGSNNAIDVRTVILETRCGCRRMMSLSDTSAPRIRVALMNKGARSAAERMLEPSDSAELLGGGAPLLEVRDFELSGQLDGHNLYREVGKSIAQGPPAPNLTSDEWADAVGRFCQSQDRMFGPEWAAVREDFHRRHDGATILVHAPTGTLIGAFYPSPRWEQSDETLHLFRMLSELMNARETDRD